ALIFAIGDKFKSADFDVYYSTLKYTNIISKYPNENWIKSFLQGRILRVPILGLVYIIIKLLCSKEHQQFDVIVSAPGGYINSYYGFKRKIQLLALYKIL